jgi:hypothetical protein
MTLQDPYQTRPIQRFAPQSRSQCAASGHSTLQIPRAETESRVIPYFLATCWIKVSKVPPK